MTAVSDAVAQIPVSRRGLRTRPEVWSVNAYAAHLVDAARVIVWRVRAIATEDNPYLPYHQQDEAASEGDYDTRDADGSIAQLQGHVREYLDLVRALPETAWSRVGTHQEAGAVRLSDIAHDMGHELSHHAADIREIGASATR